MRFSLFFASLAAALVGTGDVAHASGPVERLQQVMLHPTDPNIVVVRWGVASEGFLYSRDGGKTFAALCSDALTPTANDPGSNVSKISRITGQLVNGNAAVLLDPQGHVIVAQNETSFTDDGTGCDWSTLSTLQGLWPIALRIDPAAPTELVALVNKPLTDDGGYTSRVRFMRRDASGAWSAFEEAPEVIPDVPGQAAFGSELVINGTQMYASVRVSDQTSPQQKLYIVRSSDGGKTWTAGPQLPPAQARDFSLLGVDAKDNKRVVGVISTDNAADTLLLSTDEGQTFAPWAEVRQATGFELGPDGRVYISDAGDATIGPTSVGGLWTAAQLGEPLTRIENTATFDCVTYDARKDLLYVCQGDKVRQFDPVNETYGDGDAVVKVSKVEKLLSCPNQDVAALCEAQLTAGAAWCCTGHFPCSPFCSMWDVTERDGVTVYCGVSGLEQDLSIGRTCEGAASDAGVPEDAGAPSVPDASAPEVRDAGNLDAAKPNESTRKKDDGCSLGLHRSYEDDAGGALASLGLLLLLLGRTLRRRAAAER